MLDGLPLLPQLPQLEGHHDERHQRQWAGSGQWHL
jgi:hypothetical protein